MNKIYALLPNLKYVPITNIIPCYKNTISKTYNWLHDRKILYNDVPNYLTKIYPHLDTQNGADLIKYCINFESRYSRTHDILYHGSRYINLILLRSLFNNTIINANYYILRDYEQISHNRYFLSAYDYTISHLKKYMINNTQLISRYDNHSPVKSELLSAVDHLTANIEHDACEDALRFILDPSQYGVPEQYLTQCLSNNKINPKKPYPKMLEYGLSGLLMIAIPKTLSHLMYPCYPFGFPIGLEDIMYLDYEQGDRHEQKMEIMKRLDNYSYVHNPSKIQGFNLKYPQLRVLINPTYFNNPSSGIIMKLFVNSNEKYLYELHNQLSVCI